MLQGLLAGLKDINGAYDNHQLIGGAGHFSVVYRAKRRADGALVALKFYNNPGAASYRLDCFTREGQLLDGPMRGEEHFVQLTDPPSDLAIPLTPPGVVLPVPFVLKCPFLPLEWMPDGDAEKLIAYVTTRDELLKRLDAFWKMCGCVARAHHLGCIHRDLKPGNFLLNGASVKLADFGTAKIVAHPPLQTVYNSAPGARTYTAPEALAGIDVGNNELRLGDYYSLGAILFELLTQQQLSSHTIGGLQRIIQFEKYLRAVPDSKRSQVYDGFLVGQGPMVPDFRRTNPNLPKCSYPLLNRILVQLSHFDYRQREPDLYRTRDLVRRCILMLRNEVQYLAMLKRRREVRKKGRTT